MEYNLKKRIDQKTAELNIELQNTYDRLKENKKILAKRDNTIRTLEIRISELKSDNEKLKPITNEPLTVDRAYKNAIESDNEIIKNFNIDLIKILATFYDNDALVDKDIFKNHIKATYSFSKSLVGLKIDQLKKLKLVSENEYTYQLTIDGEKIIEELFSN